MDHKKLNRLIAVVLFLVSLVVYAATLSKTVVFWDVGEFCAAAFSLQVPHPPGAPLFLLIARVSSMIPFVHDIAVRMHILSAIGSGLTIAMLYLVTVDLMVMWRGIPQTLFDRLTVYGSAVIGALSLAFNKTFWSNAIEAEVYGLGMFFVGLILWLGLRWYERGEKDTGDRYLLLIAYIVGLSVGVHLLSILALFPLIILMYFRQYEFEWRTFLKFGFAGVVVFFIIYPGVVIELPSLLDGDFHGTQSQLFVGIPLVLVVAAAYYVYRSQAEKKRLLNMAVLSFLLIIIGYSTYIMVFIRANAHPPMNENDPSTPARLVSYLNREQYGSAPMLNRRWDSDPEKKAYHQRYTSDLDYMWRYQIVHMYLRYLGWDYIGSAGDQKDAGVDWKDFYAIPFVLGLFGAYVQWRKQPKMALMLTVMFVVMGVILALYQNQQEPQPRERDYFYVGSFFAFSLWIGIGVLGLIDVLRERLTDARMRSIAGYGVLAAAFVFVPANMLRVNYHEANRTGNYVAWDYSYNLLQSCDQDAILFTNGDNDTFPLWYLQDVEGIRRDVRIVNLSLVNTPWYIKQLKHETPYGALRVPISTSDADIASIQPIAYEPRMMDLPVGPDVLQRYDVERSSMTVLDSSIIRNGILRFYMPNTMQFGDVKVLRVQDIMVFDIIRTNRWQRPVYFAMTVSDDGKIGLKDYMQLTGLAFKLVPFRSQAYWANIDEPKMRAQVFTNVTEPSKTPKAGFRWRGLQNPKTYYDEDTRRLLTNNYRNMFISLALYYANVQNRLDQVSPVLDRMEEVMPREVIPIDYRIKFDVANFYRSAGNDAQYKKLTGELIDELKGMIDHGVSEPLSQYNPYILLYFAYTGENRFKDAEDLLPVIKQAYASTQGIDQIVAQLQGQLESRKAASGLADSTAPAPPKK